MQFLPGSAEVGETDTGSASQDAGKIGGFAVRR
jgi:hypothetical protein